MATTNANSNVYVSNLTGSTKIYMDIDPSPPPIIPNAKRKTSIKQCLPGSDDLGNYIGGQAIIFDAGSHISGTEFSWACSKCLPATKIALETLYENQTEDVFFSLDDGINIYKAVWQELNITRNDGRSTYNLEIKLIILYKYT